MLCKRCAFTEEEFKNIVVYTISKIAEGWGSANDGKVEEQFNKLRKLLSVYDPDEVQKDKDAFHA